MQKIHVVHIITKLELGGAQKVCLSLFQGLPAYAISTSLISGNRGPLVQSVQSNSSTYLLPSLQREISFKAVIQEIKTFYSLVRTLKKLKAQYPTIIVHTHSTKAGLLGRWAALLARVSQRVHTVHGYGFNEHQPRVLWLCIYILELITSFITTHYVCVSEKDRALGTKIFPGFKQKSSLIRAASHCDTTYIPAQRTTWHKDTFIFGTVSAFKPQKNLLDLIHAFVAVYKQNAQARLEIIGDGTTRKELEALIAHYSLQDVVTLHGWQENVGAFMAQWDAFVLSSLWEGLPCAVVEARLYKLPVIAYDTGGISEVIKHGQNGLLCAQKDWETLAYHMDTLADSQKFYAQLSSYKDNLHSFTPATMIQEHAQLYTMLYASHRKGLYEV